MLKKTLADLLTKWVKTQKTKIAESAREELRQAAKLGQRLVVMELR